MGRKLLKTVQTITTFRILSRTPWEPVADPLWSADPSLKTAALTVQQFDLGSLTFNLSNCTCTDDVYAISYVILFMTCKSSHSVGSVIKSQYQ